MVGRLPYDGWHNVSDVLPQPNVQLRIDCGFDDCGGAAALGVDGQWYWTYDGELADVVPFVVTRWQYL